MNIMLNGKARDVDADTLAAALEELGYGNATVATAHNGEFVAVHERSDTPLAPGDRIEVVAPMQGG